MKPPSVKTGGVRLGIGRTAAFPPPPGVWHCKWSSASRQHRPLPAATFVEARTRIGRPAVPGGYPSNLVSEFFTVAAGIYSIDFVMDFASVPAFIRRSPYAWASFFLVSGVG